MYGVTVQIVKKENVNVICNISEKLFLKSRSGSTNSKRSDSDPQIQNGRIRIRNPVIMNLLQAGASARYVNSQLQSAPIHVAAEDGKPNMIALLLKYPSNKV